MNAEYYADHNIGTSDPCGRMLRIIFAKMPGASEFDHIDLAAGVYAYCNAWHAGQASDEYAMLGAIDLRNPPILHLPEPGDEPDDEPDDEQGENDEWPGAVEVYHWLRTNNHANARRYFPLCLQ